VQVIVSPSSGTSEALGLPMMSRRPSSPGAASASELERELKDASIEKTERDGNGSCSWEGVNEERHGGHVRRRRAVRSGGRSGDMSTRVGCVAACRCAGRGVQTTGTSREQNPTNDRGANRHARPAADFRRPGSTGERRPILAGQLPANSSSSGTRQTWRVSPLDQVAGLDGKKRRKLEFGTGNSTGGQGRNGCPHRLLPRPETPPRDCTAFPGKDHLAQAHASADRRRPQAVPVYPPRTR